MFKKFKTGSNYGDAVTGERILPGAEVFDTGIRNAKTPWIGRGKTKVIKEDTIVWLAEQAGFTVTKRNGGDSGNAKVVDGTDVSVGGGEAEAGEVEAGGKPTVKRRSNGAVKSK
jgi:hypothetical protein